MKKKVLVLMVGFLFIGVNVFAADGDLTVDGNVGIGTTNPGAKLEIMAAGPANLLNLQASSGGTGAIYQSYKNTGGSLGIGVDSSAGGYLVTGNPAYAASIYTTNTTAIVLAPNQAPALTAINGGNVGIGTAAPGYRLSIKGVDSNAETLELINSNNTNSFTLGAGGDNFYIKDKRAGTIPLSIQYNGNVGIGTMEPGGYRLYVAGTAYSTGGWQSSDIRFKENITSIESPLSKILGIEGISFDWKKDEFKDKGFPEGRHYGVIAQRVEKVLPEVVREGPGGEKSVSYTEIIPVLIEAIKEQQREIGELKTEINELRSSIPKNVASLQR